MGIAALSSGVLFGAGLALSGMGQPQRVLGFLDFAGAFDPALALVMVGAIAVHFVAQRVARRRSSPLLATAFPNYSFAQVDARLIGGSILFGLGWGIAGFCPGPGIISAGAGTREGLLFVPSMLAGMVLYHAVAANPRRDETGGPAAIPPPAA
jgi:uncharacterized membrane protein YedE/YeeE